MILARFSQTISFAAQEDLIQDTINIENISK